MALTPEERAAKGGHARAASLSPEARSESARKAVRARWAKKHPCLTDSITVRSALTFGYTLIWVVP